MQTHVILSRLSPEAIQSPKEFYQVATTVSEKIKTECPKVVWKHSYVTLGRFDIVDVVESDDLQQVEKAATIIRQKAND